MRLLLPIITLAATLVALAGCGTKTPLVLPPAPVPAATPQPAQPLPANHSNAPGAAQ
ncbi:MAG: lipoprotein [Sterolibacterium sp.]